MVNHQYQAQERASHSLLSLIFHFLFQLYSYLSFSFDEATHLSFLKLFSYPSHPDLLSQQTSPLYSFFSSWGLIFPRSLLWFLMIQKSYHHLRIYLWIYWWIRLLCFNLLVPMMEGIVGFCFVPALFALLR